MIYIIDATRIDKENGIYCTSYSDDRILPVPSVIEASSTKDAMDLAKEIVDDIYQCDISLHVSTVEKFPMPMFKGEEQDDCCILLECYRIDGKWSYII